MPVSATCPKIDRTLCLWIAIDMPIHDFSLCLQVAHAQCNVSLSDFPRERLLQSEAIAMPDMHRLENEYLNALRGYIETPVPREKLQALGEELACLLFPPSIQDALLAELAHHPDPLAPVRLHLHIDSLTLQKLPWEFAFVNFPGLPAGFLGQSPRFRLVHKASVLPPAPAVSAEPLRVLLAWSDPRSGEYPTLPYLQTEVRCVLAALQAHRGVQVEQIAYATAGALERALMEWRPHILHFIGHGDLKPTGGILALHGDQTGSVTTLYGEKLVRWLSLDTLRLVVLSACRTAGSERSVGAVLSRAGVAAVLAMQLPLRDASAELFSGAFYSALLEPRPVEEALQRARKAISGLGADWGVPSLYLRGESGELFRFPTPTDAIARRTQEEPGDQATPEQIHATFLFTDIEGSARLWEEHPEIMRLALGRHDTLLRQALESQRGSVFKTMGDSFCAVFDSAVDAVRAAFTAQRSLCAEVWPAPLHIKVRMALHTGEAEKRNADYFGPPLNRVSRLLSLGHGGQILVSQAVVNLTHELLPEEVRLQPLGEHRLKDLARPETVYQLQHPALPADFARLRSLDDPGLPNNLPQQVTSFIGRETEIPAVKERLARSRLLTLVGPGGCGKTRLALQVALDSLEMYPDGVWLVELAPLNAAAYVAQAAAQVLKVAEIPGQPLLQTLAEALRLKHLLLILDNCEHLLAASAQLTDALLRSCHDVKILVSSREPLNIPGEAVYRVPSLSLPDMRQPITLETLRPVESVRLFIERATLVAPGFTATEANAFSLAAVCHRLDGIPLAIELAAVRIRSMGIEQIAERLHDRFRLLTGGSRTALPRQQTLRALIDWSYSLLTAQEQALLCRLSVFAGGWTLDAAEHICADSVSLQSPLPNAEPVVEDWEILDLMTALVDKSLVLYEQRPDGSRYRLLETVREYAREALKESPSAETIRHRHALFFQDLAIKAAEGLRSFEQRMWLLRLDEEHDNLRHATQWAQSGALATEIGVRIPAELWQFWYIRGYFSEGQAFLEAACKQEEADPELLAKAHTGLGMLIDSPSLAVLRFEQGVALARQANSRWLSALALCGLGFNYRVIDREQGEAFQVEALLLAEEIGDPWLTATILSTLGGYNIGHTTNRSPRADIEEGLALAQLTGDQWLIAEMMVNLGFVAHSQGDYESAENWYSESLELQRQIDARQNLAIVLHSLGNLVLKRGDLAKAQDYFRESLQLRKTISHAGIASSLEGFAFLAAVAGQYRPAARLMAAATHLRDVFGLPIAPLLQADHARFLPLLRANLTAEQFQTAWSEGDRLTPLQAIEYALEFDVNQANEPGQNPSF